MVRSSGPEPMVRDRSVNKVIVVKVCEQTLDRAKFESPSASHRPDRPERCGSMNDWSEYNIFIAENGTFDKKREDPNWTSRALSTQSVLSGSGSKHFHRKNMNLFYFNLNFLCLLVLIIIIGVNGEAKHTEYYDKLGVSPTADGRAIKKGNFP